MDDLRVGHVTIPGDELKIRFTRSSGPGGQNVNKRSTRAEITFPIATSRLSIVYSSFSPDGSTPTSFGP